MIPMVNLKAQYDALRPQITARLDEVLTSCSFILGPQGQAFECEVATYLGVKHAIGVASGTDALHLALRAAGIGPGDEVITTPFTFIATAEAICYTGATPVFVDIDYHSFNLDPRAVEQAITPHTKAILPVHLFGQPADLPQLQAIAARHGLLLIEDCAQSFGARIDGQHTGSFGVASAFSFFPSKNLGAYGDGGLVTTQDDAIATRIVALRNHGSTVRYYHDEIGYNSRLDEMQAAILRVKLPEIDAMNQRRRAVARHYNALLADLPLVTPHEDGIGEHVFHQYTLLTDRREAIQQALQAEHIASAIYYPVPLHRQRVFAERYRDVALPVAEDVAARCLSLPICPFLLDEHIARIAGVIRRVLS